MGNIYAQTAYIFAKLVQSIFLYFIIKFLVLNIVIHVISLRKEHYKIKNVYAIMDISILLI